MDNQGLNKQMLLNLGLLNTNITVSNYCTVENSDLFYSYRKYKDSARNITIIKRKSSSKIKTWFINLINQFLFHSLIILYIT